MKFEENLIDNDNWRHGVKYIVLCTAAHLFALKNSSDHYIHMYILQADSEFCAQCHLNFDLCNLEFDRIYLIFVGVSRFHFF